MIRLRIPATETCPPEYESTFSVWCEECGAEYDADDEGRDGLCDDCLEKLAIRDRRMGVLREMIANGFTLAEGVWFAAAEY